MNWRRIMLAILPVFVLVTLAGCPFVTSPGPDPPPPPPPPPPNSIDGVLDALTKSYTEMNYDNYTRIFNPAYTYIFAPQNVGQDGIPASWGLADELVSAQHLLSKTDANRDGYIAERITLSYVRGPEIPNDMENWTKVVLSQIFLTVSTRNGVSGDPLDYIVQGDQAYLWFAKVGDAWSIVRWEDKPIQVAKALIAEN